MNCGWPSAPAQDPLRLLELDVAAVQDVERAEELLAEHLAAPRIVRQRDQGRDRRTHAGEPPEVGFQTPHGDDDAWVDAECLGDALKQNTVFRIHLLRGAHGVAGEAAPEVDLEVERELRLRSIALQDLLDRQDAGQCPIEDLGPDSAGGRFAAERQQPVVEGQRRRRNGGNWRDVPALRLSRPPMRRRQRQPHSGSSTHCSSRFAQGGTTPGLAWEPRQVLEEPDNTLTCPVRTFC